MTPPEDSGARPLHLLKMAVGVANLDELRRMRAERSQRMGGSFVYTRNHPRRAAELLAGGSLYWVIRGQVRVRQRLTGLTTARDEKGRAYCLLAVDRELVPTLLRPWRPFQGWRYLSPADAPPDLRTAMAAMDTDDAPMPEHLVAELRALGLW